MNSETTYQTYAVPYDQHEPFAVDRIRRRVQEAIGDDETHAKLGYPMVTYRVQEYFPEHMEAWVRIGGVSAMHSAMLAEFAWIPAELPKEAS